MVPYDELLRLTDPAHVTMEMDCGWVMVGGANPIDYLRQISHAHHHAARKGFQDITPTHRSRMCPRSFELGQGSIDYRPIFAAGSQIRSGKALLCRAGRLQRAADGGPEN